LLPGLHLVFNLTLWQIAQFLPAWAYVGLTIWDNKIYTSRRDFERHFSFTGKVLAAIIPGFAVVSRIGGAFSGAIPYLIIYLLAGVCLMRILREEGKLTASRNIAVLATLLITSAALALLQTPQIILGAAGFIYRNVIAWIILGFAYLFASIIYGFFWVLNFIFNFRLAEENEVQGDLEVIEHGVTGVSQGAILRELPAWLETAIVVFLALVVMFVLFLIMRSLLGKKKETRKEKYYTEEQERLQRQSRGYKGGIFRPKDPRHAIRWYYRKYLKEGASRGAQPGPADTSLSILKKFGVYFPGDEAGKLRGLYIAARYRFSGEISKAQVESASKTWRNLKQD
jgi:hypothetical protein